MRHEIDFLMSEAYSTNLIGKQVIEDSTKTKPERVKVLLEVITARIKTDQGTTFKDFLKLLTSHSCLKNLATRLEQEFHSQASKQLQHTSSRHYSNLSRTADFSNNSLTDDESEEDRDPQYPNSTNLTRSQQSKKYHKPKDSKAATLGGQLILEDYAIESDYESGVATASEPVSGDVISDDNEEKWNSAEAYLARHPQQSRSQPLAFTLPDYESVLSTMDESVNLFPSPVQSAEQTDLINAEHDQPSVKVYGHTQVSEQAQYGASTLVHGSKPAEND